jgi:hypothetical protein
LFLSENKNQKNLGGKKFEKKLVISQIEFCCAQKKLQKKKKKSNKINLIKKKGKKKMKKKKEFPKNI